MMLRQMRASAYGNDKIRPELLEYAQAKLAVLAKGEDPGKLPPPAWRGMPTKGTNNVLCFLIDFPDKPHVNSFESITNKLFGAGLPAEFPLESLTKFYQRSSYGQLTINGSALGWYTMAHPRDWYTDTYGTGNEANYQIIKEVAEHFDASINYSQFDNNGDGRIDYFAVLWAGPDNGWANFWWGYQWELYSANLTLDGVRFFSFSWQWESNPVGSPYYADVIIHETGHALGLPDYYDYDGSVGPDGGVGGMDMMDANYCDHNCFSKFILDWLTPTVVTSSLSQFPQQNSADYPEAVALAGGYTGSTAFSEYFMVQNRQKVNNDKNLPGSGLVVWHVDSRLNGGGTDYQYDNSFTAHKLLRLMEADGLEEIEAGANADAGDFYGAGKEFTPSSTPNSSFYNGSNSQVRVNSIVATNLVVLADYSVVDNYPVVDPPRVYVRENGTTNVAVSLYRPVETNTVITISWLSGSSNLYLVGSPSLTFTPADWSNAQTFAVGALNDADMINDTASFRITASGGGVQSADFVVEQMDMGDTLPPQCTLSGSLSADGTRIIVDILFDESVLGFEAGDLVYSSNIQGGASLASLDEVVAGRRYEATFDIAGQYGSLSLTIPAASLTDASGNLNPNPEYRYNYTLPFLRTDYQEDFEGLATDWTASTQEFEDYTTVGWRWGVPVYGLTWAGPLSAVSGSKCLGTMDGPYAKRLDAWIESPVIRVGSRPLLSFQLWIEAGMYSLGRVEVHNGYGWVDVTPGGIYQSTSNTWVRQDIELDDDQFGNRLLRVRFRALAYLAGDLIPMYVDDVAIQSQQPPGIYVTSMAPDNGAAGTTVPVAWSIYNSTASGESNVMGFVTCADSGVVITNGTPVWYGNVAAGGVATGAAPVQVELGSAGSFDTGVLTFNHQARAGRCVLSSDTALFTVTGSGVSAPHVLTVGNSGGVTNWIGDALPGDGGPGSCLFQVIYAGSNGVADVPRVDGGVTGDDRILAGAVDASTVGRFGEGGVVRDAGLFSRVVCHGLASNSMIFVRAWDRSAFADSAAYGDSALRAVRLLPDETIDFGGWGVSRVLNFPGASLLDMVDRDGDSIPDAWCAVFGIDPDRPILPLPASVTMEAAVNGLNRPGRVAVSSNLVFIADSGNNRVEVWNRALTTRLFQYGSFGTATNQFKGPQGLTVSEDGTRLLVADILNYRITMFSVDPVSGQLTYLWSAGTQGVATNGNLFFRAPYNASLMTGNSFLVADSHPTDFYANHSIHIYPSVSDPVTLIGTTPGTGDGSFMRPLGVDAGTAGEVYVADSGNHRIQGFLSDGTFSWAFGSYGTNAAQFKEPRDVSLGVGGRLYVAETGGSRLQVLDVAAAPVVESIALLGSSGSGSGQFRAPQGVAPAMDDGIIYVADTFNNRVQKLRVVLDGDKDGMEDVWEELHGLDCHNSADAFEDPDGDGLLNIGEYRLNTDPQQRDTNGNGASDGWDVAHGLNPASAGSSSVAPPTVLITSDAGASVLPGMVVRVTAAFSEPVTNIPGPKLTLDGGAFLWQAPMVMSDASTWYYDYTVQSGDDGAVNAYVGGAVDMEGYSLDLDPTMASSLFTVGTVSSLSIAGFNGFPQALSWEAVLDGIYHIQSSTNLLQTNLWIDVGAVTSPVNGMLIWTNTTPETNRLEFFRILWINAP